MRGRTKEEMEQFHHWLRRNGLKKTYQKDLILETFLNLEGHLSVDDIYVIVKKRDRRIGVVTVFRTLKALTECGLAQEVALGDGLTRFEHTWHNPYHHHIVCTKCGQTIEFTYLELDRLHQEIMQKYDFKPTRYWFKTDGICANCQKDQSPATPVVYNTELVLARDAIAMAQNTATQLREFLRGVIAHNRDTGGNQIFERMLQLNETYLTQLDSQRAELLQTAPQTANAPLFLHFDHNILGKILPTMPHVLKREENFLNIAPENAIDLVRNMTAIIADLFRDYATAFPDTAGQRILLSFASHAETCGEI